MTYNVVITDPAIGDIIEIADYIKKLTGNDDISDEYLTGILQTAKTLNEMPYRFRISDEPALAELGVRMIPYKEYLIAYGIEEDASAVIVYRVLYSRSDIRKRFFGN